MAEDCVRSFRDHSWPGNVRELRNVIEAQLSCAARQSLHPTDQAGTETAPDFTIRLGASLKEVEAELIFRTLASVGGNKTRGPDSRGCIGVAFTTCSNTTVGTRRQAIPALRVTAMVEITFEPTTP